MQPTLALVARPTYLDTSRIGIAERSPGTLAVVVVVAPVEGG